MKEKKPKPKKETNASRLGALSSYNLANAEEARPMADEMQRVWFGGGGERT